MKPIWIQVTERKRGRGPLTDLHLVYEGMAYPEIALAFAEQGYGVWIAP
jgi:hypothetical protein